MRRSLFFVSGTCVGALSVWLFGQVAIGSPPPPVSPRAVLLEAAAVKPTAMGGTESAVDYCPSVLSIHALSATKASIVQPFAPAALQGVSRTGDT
jgi:hypothetical protein